MLQLKKAGIDARALRGGYNAWRRAGCPMEALAPELKAGNVAILMLQRALFRFE